MIKIRFPFIASMMNYSSLLIALLFNTILLRMNCGSSLHFFLNHVFYQNQEYPFSNSKYCLNWHMFTYVQNFYLIVFIPYSGDLSAVENSIALILRKTIH